MPRDKKNIAGNEEPLPEEKADESKRPKSGKDTTVVKCKKCGADVNKSIAMKAFADVGVALCATCYNLATTDREKELSEQRQRANKAPYEQTIDAEFVNEPSTNMPVPTIPHDVGTAKQAATSIHQYTDDEINTIKNTVAKGASDSELKMFLHVCETYGLDPFLKEIFYSQKMKTIITSRDGYLKAAQRDLKFDGIQSMAVFSEDEFEVDVAAHTVNHKFGKGDRGKIIGAWAIVYKRGILPVIAYADYKEYKKNTSIWETYKSAMCCKVAEAFALKRQFGISGLVTQEEIDYADTEPLLLEGEQE